MTKSLQSPVFVRSTANYEAYTDFWRLVELSSFPVIPAAKVELHRDGLYIWPTMDMEFIERLSREPRGSRAAKVIFWNVERPDEKPGVDVRELFQRAMGEILEWADEIWISDMSLHAIDRRTVFAILGGHAGLNECSHRSMTYDVAHLGRLTPRRIELLKVNEERGLKISPNEWGPDRSRILAASQLLLNIDRVEGLHLASPLRWALAAAYGLPIVTEEAPEPYPMTAGKDLVMAPHADLADLVVETLGRRDILSLSHQGWETLCNRWTFRRGVEDALRRTPLFAK